MAPSASNKLISIQPDELKFIFELEKQSYCDLKVANQTEHYVAFKVKTTSPKKYFVRPNTGLIQPWDSCIIRVTLQALRECPPPDMQCKDKFLFQSAIVPPHTYVHELPQNTFNKDSGKRLEECKLKVSYISPPSPKTSFESGVTNNEGHIPKTISRLKEERDAATKKTQQLQLELDMLKTQINERNDQGFTLKIAAFVGLIGLILGFILKLSLSPPQQQTILVNTLYDLNK